ncbi:hypothetical protein MJT46_018108 [Ovis ammon polii x Ovis aries]|nr:hypothetical protein MJT46_018108 [Ovis ammon polii x Ovis aries]
MSSASRRRDLQATIPAHQRPESLLQDQTAVPSVEGWAERPPPLVGDSNAGSMESAPPVLEGRRSNRRSTRKPQSSLFKVTVPETHGRFGLGWEVFCTCGLHEAAHGPLRMMGFFLGSLSPGTHSLATPEGLGLDGASPGGTAGQKAASVHERKPKSS